MKLAPFRICMTALALLMIASACADGPTGITPGEANFDNGGSYGSGGRTANPDSAGTTGTTTADAGGCAEERNGGSYGSGGRSAAEEGCPVSE